MEGTTGKADAAAINTAPFWSACSTTNSNRPDAHPVQQPAPPDTRHRYAMPSTVIRRVPFFRRANCLLLDSDVTSGASVGAFELNSTARLGFCPDHMSVTGGDALVFGAPRTPGPAPSKPGGSTPATDPEPTRPGRRLPRRHRPDQKQLPDITHSTSVTGFITSSVTAPRGAQRRPGRPADGENVHAGGGISMAGSTSGTAMAAAPQLPLVLRRESVHRSARVLGSSAAPEVATQQPRPGRP